MSIASRIAGLAPEKRALLERMLLERRAAGGAEAAVAEPGTTLSAAQRRMWTLHQLDPTGRAYHVPLVLSLEGPLDRTALARTLRLIAERHDGLRLAVTGGDGEPVADILDTGLALETIAWPDGQSAEQAVTAFVERPFDPARGLARAGLLEAGPSRAVLALVFHHLVFDGSSIPVLLEELDEAYRALRRGRPPMLPELGWRYSDYAAWESGALASGTFEASRAAWRERLEGAPNAVSFAGSAPLDPPDRAYTVKATMGSGTAAYAAVRRLAAEEGTTPFAVLLAALAALLGRWSRAEDMVIGTESAAGVPSRFGGIIGLFLNPLPVRIETGGAPTLRALVRHVRDRLAEALAHGQYPFDRIAADLRQSGQRQPLFNIAVSLRTQGMDAFPLDDLMVTPHPGGSAHESPPKFDLAVSLIDTGAIVGGAIEGDAKLWSREALDCFVRAFEGLLADASAAPDRAVLELPLVGGEPAVVVPAAPLAAEDFAGLFEAAHDRGPDAPALWFGGVETSHAALEVRANRLAHALIAEGAGRGRHVALFIDRDHGPDLVAAVLAVLKAGAAFTVLDPRQASSRHRAMLEDAAPALVIAGDAVPVEGLWRVVALAELERGGFPATRPVRKLVVEDAAYIVFTSGSTGRPKGVVATHGGLAALAAAQQAAFALGPADRVVQFSAVTFDAFAWDLAMAWARARRW
jgi:hypothetical protein